MIRARVVLAVLVALGSGCWAAEAAAYVYWPNVAGNTIGRANLDGTSANQSLITGASGPVGVAVDGQHVYWANFNAGTVGRANLDGSGADQSFITGANGPVGVAVDGQHVYWANDGGGNTIGRANLDGSGANQSFITGAAKPFGVAVDGQHVYWANFGTGTVGRANLDGSGADQSFITGASAPVGVAVDGQHVYWANFVVAGTVGRANLDGSGADQSFITGANAPVGVAIDGQHVYWANDGIGTVGRANLDGSGADQSFITGANGPVGVAVDGGPAGRARPSTASLSFATQPLDTLGAPQALSVTNTGHGVLQTGRAQVTNGDSDDFLISADTCSGATLQIGDACAIDVRFGPSATGLRGATLTLTSNDTNGALQIPMSGTGGQLPQGPPGATSPAGAPGRQGAPGKRGLVTLVTCRTVSRTVAKKVHGKRKRVTVKRQVCTTKTVTGPVKFTTAAVDRAVLSRAGISYATGVALRANKHPELLLSSKHPLARGRYTLTLTSTDHHHKHTTHQNITIERGMS